MGINMNVGSRGPRYTIEHRFWTKVNNGIRPPDDTCWLWTGSTDRLGYGTFWDGTYTDRGSPRMVGAHRWAYAHFVEDPGALHVRHRCDTPACVNYTLCLVLGTVAENMRDRDTRGRGVMPDLKGFSRGRGSRFTADQVREMRRTFTGARGEVKALALAHGVSHQTISAILRGRSWKE